MGETRVALLHLLEDLRDAYPGSLEETILTEIIANALDSGTRVIRLDGDPSAGALAVAMALAPLAVQPADGQAFITAFLTEWGEAGTGGRDRKGSKR